MLVNSIPEEAANGLTTARRKIFSGRREPCGTVKCIFITDIMDGGWDAGRGGGGGGRQRGKERGKKR